MGMGVAATIECLNNNKIASKKSVRDARSPLPPRRPSVAEIKRQLIGDLPSSQGNNIVHRTANTSGQGCQRFSLLPGELTVSEIISKRNGGRSSSPKSKPVLPSKSSPALSPKSSPVSPSKSSPGLLPKSKPVPLSKPASSAKNRPSSLDSSPPAQRTVSPSRRRVKPSGFEKSTSHGADVSRNGQSAGFVSSQNRRQARNRKSSPQKKINPNYHHFGKKPLPRVNVPTDETSDANVPRRNSLTRRRFSVRREESTPPPKVDEPNHFESMPEDAIQRVFQIVDIELLGLADVLMLSKVSIQLNQLVRDYLVTTYKLSLESQLISFEKDRGVLLLMAKKFRAVLSTEQEPSTEILEAFSFWNPGFIKHGIPVVEPGLSLKYESIGMKQKELDELSKGNKERRFELTQQMMDMAPYDSYLALRHVSEIISNDGILSTKKEKLAPRMLKSVEQYLLSCDLMSEPLKDSKEHINDLHLANFLLVLVSVLIKDKKLLRDNMQKLYDFYEKNKEEFSAEYKIDFLSKLNERWYVED